MKTRINKAGLVSMYLLESSAFVEFKRKSPLKLPKQIGDCLRRLEGSKKTSVGPLFSAFTLPVLLLPLFCRWIPIVTLKSIRISTVFFFILKSFTIVRLFWMNSRPSLFEALLLYGYGEPGGGPVDIDPAVGILRQLISGESLSCTPELEVGRPDCVLPQAPLHLKPEFQPLNLAG